MTVTIDALMWFWWSHLEQLDREPKGRPTDFMALCPAHDDHDPSLHVSQGTDKHGRPCVRMHCFAGCDEKEVCAAADRSIRDLFLDEEPQAMAKESSTSNASPLSRTASATASATATATATGQVPSTMGNATRSMMARYKSGERPDFTVRLALDRLPPQANTTRAVGEFVEWWMGLRLTDLDPADVPLPGTTVAEGMGWDPVLDEGRARRHIHALERYEIIRFTGALADIGDRRGARCFQPYGFDLVDVTTREVDSTAGVDSEPIVDVPPEIDVVGEPAAEVVEELEVVVKAHVGGEALALDGEVSPVGVVAPGNGAGLKGADAGGVGNHGGDPNGASDPTRRLRWRLGFGWRYDNEPDGTPLDDLPEGAGSRAGVQRKDAS
jgi:hypothetical protein